MSDNKVFKDGQQESIITHVPPMAHSGSAASKYQTNPNVVSRHSLSKQPYPVLIEFLIVLVD